MEWSSVQQRSKEQSKAQKTKKGQCCYGSKNVVYNTTYPRARARVRCDMVLAVVSAKKGQKSSNFEAKINCTVWRKWWMVRTLTFSYNHVLKVLAIILAITFGLALSNTTASILTK